MQRNSTAHGGHVTVDGAWQFGQILAVMMIFANINEVVNCLFGYINRRRKRSHEPQAEEAQQAPNEADVPPASSPYRARGLPGTHLSGKAYCTAWYEWGAKLHSAARDASQTKLSSEFELLNLKENVRVSEITVGEDPPTRDQPVGTLR